MGDGASHGKNYATRICKRLDLKPNQVSFFFGHGDTDVGHTADILKVIDACHLTKRDWDWMCHAARTAGVLYINMYNEALLGANQSVNQNHGDGLSTTTAL